MTPKAETLENREICRLDGVTTKRLNEQVRRNRGRFPADFMFQLSAQEAAVLRSQSATSKPSGRGGRRYLPNVFTEHGAIMAATVLATPRAIEMSIYVVRAFVKLRELLSSNRRLARKLEVLERSLLALDLKTQRRFKEVYDAIRALMREPAPKRRGIGFTADLDPGADASASWKHIPNGGCPLPTPNPAGIGQDDGGPRSVVL